MGRQGAIAPSIPSTWHADFALVQRSCGWLAIGAKAQGGRMNERRFSNEESQHIPAPRSEVWASGILARQDCLLGL